MAGRPCAGAGVSWIKGKSGNPAGVGKGHRKGGRKPAEVKPVRAKLPLVPPADVREWRPLVITSAMRAAAERVLELYPEPMGRPW